MASRAQLANLEKARAVRAANKVREQNAKAKQPEPALDDDTPQATVARAKAVAKRKPAAPVRRDPTVTGRRVERDPATGRVSVMGRSGKMVTRHVSHAEGDPYFIAPGEIPEGWTYQWIAVTVTGQEQRKSLASFARGGWEPVPMSRYPGRYGPAKLQGKDNEEHIVIEGLGLYERPTELTDEARHEEVTAAKNLIRTRNEQFSPKLPEARRRPGTELRAKRTIEGMPPDVGRPDYQMDVDEGLLA